MPCSSSSLVAGGEGSEDYPALLEEVQRALEKQGEGGCIVHSEELENEETQSQQAHSKEEVMCPAV